MYAHSYAISIEHVLRRVFDCERSGFAGLVDADVIENNCFAPIAAALGYMYATSDTKKKAAIETFIREYIFYLDIGIRDLVSFISNTREINGIEYTIEYENGEQALDSIIKALEAVCSM